MCKTVQAHWRRGRKVSMLYDGRSYWHPSVIATRQSSTTLLLKSSLRSSAHSLSFFARPSGVRATNIIKKLYFFVFAAVRANVSIDALWRRISSKSTCVATLKVAC